MLYYWTVLFHSGEKDSKVEVGFTYWKVEDEKQLFKLASKKYCGKAFDYGTTAEKNYKNGNKGN